MPGRAQYTEPVTRLVVVPINGVNYNLLEPLDNVQVTVRKINPDGTVEAAPGTAVLYATHGPDNTAFAGGSPIFTTSGGGKTGFFALAGKYRIDFHDLNVPARIGDQFVIWDASPQGQGEITANALPDQGRGMASPGDMRITMQAAEPAGWLFCDGRAVSRTTYAALFAAIGTANGAGDGSTTFNIPDMKGRTAVGPDDFGNGSGAAGRLSSLAAGQRVRGQGSGSDTHTLSVAQLAAHAHGVTDPGHGHSIHYEFGNAGTSVSGLPFWDMSARQYDTWVDTAGAGANISINNAGSGSPHNNLQPLLIVNYIIKT